MGPVAFRTLTERSADEVRAKPMIDPSASLSVGLAVDETHPADREAGLR